MCKPHYRLARQVMEVVVDRYTSCLVPLWVRVILTCGACAAVDYVVACSF